MLRPATPADCDDIARLVVDLATYERIAHEALATAADFQRELFGPEPHAHAMMAIVDGRAVGLALWFYNFSTFVGRFGLYVEDVYVEPAYRGLGIGRAFFRAMAQVAVARGCGRMEWAVLDWNEPAIRFYRAMGALGQEDWTTQRLCDEAMRALAQEG